MEKESAENSINRESESYENPEAPETGETPDVSSEEARDELVEEKASHSAEIGAEAPLRVEVKEEPRELKLGEIFAAIEFGEMPQDEINERVTHAVEVSSRDEYFDFLKNELCIKNSKKHLLPDEAVKAIVEKGLAVGEERWRNQVEASKDPISPDKLGLLMKSMRFYKDFRADESARESYSDKAFRAYIDLAPKYPETSYYSWQSVPISDIRPGVFVDGVAELQWRPDVDTSFKMVSLDDFADVYERNSDKYNQAIIDNLDFERPENYFKTGTFLEFIRKVDRRINWEWSDEEPFDDMEKALGEVVAKNEGSYLLNLRARNIKEELGKKPEIRSDDFNRENLSREEIVGMIEEGARRNLQFPRPIKLSRESYAVARGGAVSISEKEDKDKIEQLLEEHDNFEEEIFKTSREANKLLNEIMKWQTEKSIDEASLETPERMRMKEEWEELHAKMENLNTRLSEKKKELKELVSHEVVIDDLSIDRTDKTEEERDREYQDVYDYKYIASDSVREAIEKDFDFKFSDLSLKEQYYFLQFIKNMEASEVEPVRRFVGVYGIDGLKTFLSTDYDKEIGNRIVEIGESLEKGDAREIFAEYAQITDLSDEFREMLEGSEALQNSGLSEDLRKELPANIYEALVRRSKDLLLSAHAIGVEKRDTDLTIGDLKNALRGLRTFLDIMKNFEIQERYEFTPQKSENERVHKFGVRDRENDSEYGLKLSIRKEAEENAQARINMELNFVTKNPDESLKEAFAQITDYGKGPKTSSVLRIGIDRDTYGGGERVSLDVGRNAYESERFSRTGDKLGNLLQLASESGHHTTESFDPKYAKKEAFFIVASLFEDYLEEKSAKLSLERR